MVERQKTKKVHLCSSAHHELGNHQRGIEEGRDIYARECMVNEDDSPWWKTIESRDEKNDIRDESQFLSAT